MMAHEARAAKTRRCCRESTAARTGPRLAMGLREGANRTVARGPFHGEEFIMKRFTNNTALVRGYEPILRARLLLPAVLAFVAWLLWPSCASADWPVFGRALCVQDALQGYSAITTDGAGGAIVAWQDARRPRINIFAEHVTASGSLDPGWPANGRALLSDEPALANTDGGQEDPQIVPDGAGGAIVVWQDQRHAETSGVNIYAQHMSALGVVDSVWPSNGRALTSDGIQGGPAVVSDGAGGAIATWGDFVPGSPTDMDIYAQHILANGTIDPRW